MASAILDSVLRRQPNSYEALMLRASISMTQHQFANAKQQIQQVIAANRKNAFAWGVLCDASTELLFVTLDKSESYHDSIAYHDYAISTDRFHWQTQNSAGPDTPAGRRYLNGAKEGWQFQLFVRARKGDVYRACGPVVLEFAEGDRPMSITWRLAAPLPARLFREFSVLRGV